LVRSSIQWSWRRTGRRHKVPAAPLNSIQWVDQSLGSGPSRSLAGPPDAPLAAFGRFFGPNGLMDGFFKQHLQPYVDTSQGAGAGVVRPDRSRASAPEALQAFQRAAAVRDRFVRRRPESPRSAFR
jgi:type VI secretion system protein ImpL